MTREQWKVSALLFASGFSALVYQTVWMREFRLIFGVSTYATAAVLALFMAGLGAGSAVLGRRADSRRRPLSYYALLELLIAGAAAISPLLLGLAAKLYFASGGSQQLGLGGATLLRLALAAIVIGPATFLMGGTLPAAARSIETNADGGRRAVALLYGVNTLGAVAGVLLSTFFLIESYGNRTTLYFAVIVNVFVAVRAQLMSRSFGESEPGDVAMPAEAGESRAPGPIYAAAAIVGFTFLLMELVWYRMLSPVLGGTTYMFGLVLAVALLGIGLGGSAYALLTGSRRPTAGAFAVTCSLEALALAIPFALGDRLAIFAGVLRTLGAPAGFAGHVLSWTLVTAVVVLPAAFVAGIQFPLLIGLLGRGRDQVGRHVGAAYAWNTGGAIAGSLAGGFGLLPLLTAPTTWRLAIALLIALAGASALYAMRGNGAGGRSFATAIVSIVAMALLFEPGPTAVWRHGGIGVGRMPRFDSRNDVQAWINHTRRVVVWERDGRESSVAMVEPEQISFIVNGKTDGSARFDAPTQVTLGLIGAILHRGPENVMVVGLGTGSTAGWLGAVPSVKRVDVVELEPVVLDVARACTPVNAGAMTNAKIATHIGDAREFLLTTDRKYDVIASEPSNPYRAGIASLLTRDFYLTVRERLNRDGILVQWLQGYGVTAETMKTVYATLLSVFPHVQTWWTTNGDLGLIASVEPLVVDVELLRQRLASEPYRSAVFNTWRVDGAEGFLARMVANEDFAKMAADEALLNTDDRTVIEYGFARSISDNAAMHRQLVEDARGADATRPVALRGSVDWSLVEQLRPWSATFPTRKAPDAMAAARDGDDAALEYARAIAPRSSVDAIFISAALLASRGANDEAAELLVRGFDLSRRDAWGDVVVLGSAIDLAVELAKDSEARARRLHGALASPFVVSMQESRRQFALIAIAPLFDRCGAASIRALHAVEPHPFWERQMLVIRANCYAIAKDPLAEAAWSDLQEFAAAEASPLVTQRARPAPAGSSSGPR